MKNILQLFVYRLCPLATPIADCRELNFGPQVYDRPDFVGLWKEAEFGHTHGPVLLNQHFNFLLGSENSVVFK